MGLALVRRIGASPSDRIGGRGMLSRLAFPFLPVSAGQQGGIAAGGGGIDAKMPFMGDMGQVGAGA